VKRPDSGVETLLLCRIDELLGGAATLAFGNEAFSAGFF